MKNNFVTKMDLKEALEEFAEQIISSTAKGFLGVEGRLDKVEGRLDKVEGRLDKVENKLTTLIENVEETKQRTIEVKRRIVDLEADKPTKNEFINHEKRISKLEKKVYLPSSL